MIKLYYLNFFSPLLYHSIARANLIKSVKIKLVFSKATEIDEIFTTDLTLHDIKSTVKISSIYVAFLENMNFNDKYHRIKEHA